MSEDGSIAIEFDEETGAWREKKEPYAVVEFPTEEDYRLFERMAEFYKENHKEDN